MRKLFYIFCTLLFLLGTSCEDKKSTSKNSQSENQKTKKDTSAEDLMKAQNDKLKHKAGSIIESQAELKPFLKKYGENNPETRVRLKTSFGDIEFELYKDTPLHRANFILLVKQDYFNNTMIHRVAKGFVVQGGNSDGYETPKKRMRIGNYLIPNESSPNHPHVRGALSAAKYTEQNISEASSPFEFFIVESPNGAHHLDGKHTVFGKVTKGMDVVDEINKVEVDGNEWPIENIYIDMEIIK
ncbi:MAG: peptidylprolyl isomerase [Leeuwenhoekiella sp.]